jgi:hypothetical protein
MQYDTVPAPVSHSSSGTALPTVPLADQQNETLFHVTDPERLEAILADGLQPGQQGGFSYTDSSIFWSDAFYGGVPVYLALEPWALADSYAEIAEIAYRTLAVQAQGLELLPDLPSLIDLGFQVDLDDEQLYGDVTLPGLECWQSPGEDDELWTELPFTALRSDRQLIGALIAITGTCACINAICPDRLILLSD